jgi:hypothetical protein
MPVTNPSSKPSGKPHPADRRLHALTGLPRGICQRGPVSQVDVSVKGVRKTGTAATLSAALALRDQFKAELRAHAGRLKVWTLQQAIQKTYDAVWQQPNRPFTQASSDFTYGQNNGNTPFPPTRPTQPQRNPGSYIMQDKHGNMVLCLPSKGEVYCF